MTIVSGRIRPGPRPNARHCRADAVEPERTVRAVGAAAVPLGAVRRQSRKSSQTPAGPVVQMPASPVVPGGVSDHRLRRRGRSGRSGHSIRGCRRYRRITLGLFAPDFAARPDEIIGTPGGRRQRFALDQRARRQCIDRGWPRAGTSEQLIGADGGGHQRQDRSGQRTRRRLAGQRVGIGCRGFGRQRNRPRTRRHQPGDLALGIMRELARAGLGEIDAVMGAQPADLAFEVGALLQEAAGFVDESDPRRRHR